MVKILLIAFLVLAVPTSASATHSCRHPERVVLLADTFRPPYDPGIVAVWALLDVRDNHNRHVQMYLPYQGVLQFLPSRGRVCSVCYHFGAINGLVGRTGTVLERARIVDVLECS